MKLGTPSFRTRILAVVLTMAVIPLGLMGLWLTRSAAGSGEDLLRSRLDQYLDGVVSRVGTNWLRQRHDLLFLAEDPVVQRVLEGAEPIDVANEASPASLRRVFESLDPAVARAAIRDTSERTLWTLERDATNPTVPASLGSVLVVELPIHRRFPAGRLGTLEIHLEISALLGEFGVAPTVAGMLLGAFDRARDSPLLPLPFDPSLLANTRFLWGGDEWLAVERLTTDPGLRLVAAAPLSPFRVPFEDAARRGTWWLAVVALCGVLGAVLVTRRLTRSLERLATAAEGVSRGDLDAQIEDVGGDEVGLVAEAFNTMITSLRHTLSELSRRERLAAVGEFAASLAHEVRNPLTAIRIDLQRVEEALPPGSPPREPLTRALKEIVRLDATLGETLDVAKARQWKSAVVELRAPLDAAADAAEPAFTARQATLERADPKQASLQVRGDERPLEQLFLNLLLNAAAALGPGGRAWIEVEARGQEAIVHVHDSGTGIPDEILERVFEPLYSTRAEGTGLGLTVAQRIAKAHEGRIEIESEVGKGTTVRVHLVLATTPAGGSDIESRSGRSKAVESSGE